MAGIIIDGSTVLKFVAPMRIVSNDPAFVTDSLSLHQQAVKQNVQRWEITTNVEPSNNSSDFFIHSLVNGHTNVFEVEMPQVYRGANVKSTASLLEAQTTANKGVSSVVVNCVGEILKGEFIRFANHNKVYVVIGERSGNGAMQIYPELKAAVPAGTDILFDKDVKMRARYDPTLALGINFVDGIMSDPGSIKLVEAL